MSDPPPKPKIGSLRDRIAAFEKPNAASTPGPAPVPRPKPGNLQWKPRPPSPTQPAAAAATAALTAEEKKASGMSASDAKESIGKAGSLKERMAALQGRGGFGAPAPPPPISAKPAVERPKWKPPPPVASPPLDDVAEDAPAPEKSLEIPLEESPSAEAEAAPVEGDAAEADPEEEERQRRAALTARMARLGGARVGMGPPVFGRKPTPKPTPDDESTKSPEPAKSPEIAKSPDSQAESKSEYFPSSAAAASSDSLPVSSANKSTDSLGTDTSPSIPSRSPNSMPVPAAPRRAAPPRRKAAKSPAPPSVEERAAVNDDIEPPPPVPEVPIEPKPDELEPTIDEAQKRMSMDIVTAEVGESHVQPLAEALPTSPQAEEADVTEVPYNRDDSPTPSSPIHDDTPHLPSHKEEAPPPPDHEDTPPTIQEAEKDVPITEEPETEEVQEPFKDLEPSEVVAEHADDEEEDEEARKKRIAERMAKMGGVNPFAPPSLQRQTSAESERSPSIQRRTSSGSVKSPSVQRQMSTSSNASISEEPRIVSPTPTIPQKRSSISSVQSFEKRKASMDASLEESRPIPPPRQMSKDDHKPSGISEDAEDSAALVGEDLDLGRESDDGRDAIEDEEIPSPPPVPTASRPPPVPQTTRPTPAQSDFDEDTFVPPPPRRRLSLQRVDEPEPEREQAPALSPTNEVAESPVAQDQKSPVPAVPHHLVDESPPASPVALHIPPPRRFSSDNEERALPHPMRFSDTVDEEEEQMSHRAPPRRGVPPPPPVSAVEPDEDDMLPAPPPPPRRSIPTPSDHPSSPPTRHIPPPPPDEDDMLPAPPPPRRNLPLEPVILPPRRTGSDDVYEPDLKTPVVTVQPEQEVLSEDEGDPIDPAFHSPSRRESLADAPSPPRAAPPTHSLSPESARMSLSPTSPTSEPSLPDEPEPAVDPEQERRRTIAERMAKLGGIKFGAPPVPMGRPRRQTQESKDDEEEKYSAPQGEQGEPAVEEEKVELTEEEEERARKERISAKLAMMGGQRIGMMPPVMGSRPPPQRHVEEDEVPPPPPPQRAVPPRVRPPPAENDEAAPPPPPHRAPPPSHSETDSDDGVKVEAEESEIEEVRHEDAVEAEEEAPPPVPTRAGRRTSSVHRQGSSDTGSSHRPPVPTSPPPRRASVQGKGDTSFTYPPPPQQQADFVMVEEPERAPTKQWELPSIPAASMDFGAGPDLSMSWSEVDNAGAPPPPPAAPVKAPKNFDEMVLSPEELTAVWGRIGVQVCEAATSLHDKSKKALIGDGTYHGFIEAVLAEVPGAARPVPPLYGYTVYVQSGASVQRRAGEIMPGDVVWLSDARLKGHKGLQGYSQHVGGEGDVVGVVCEFEAKKYKVRVFQANQHVGQQTVEAVSYRLEDLKSGVVKVFRVLEA